MLAKEAIACGKANQIFAQIQSACGGSDFVLSIETLIVNLTTSKKYDIMETKHTNVSTNLSPKEVIKMMLNHNEYLNYKLPDNWCAEEDNDNLLLYNSNGNGAITLSFFNVLNTDKSIDEHVTILAKRLIDQNNINLPSPLILFNREGKKILWGTGTTSDSWFIKLWIVAKYPKMVLATYLSERKNTEVKTCDSIIDSFRFTF